VLLQLQLLLLLHQFSAADAAQCPLSHTVVLHQSSLMC